MGLMYPSRKQTDQLTARGGSSIRLQKPVTRVADINISRGGAGTQTDTLLAVPAGLKATLLYVEMRINNTANVNSSFMSIDGERLTYLSSTPSVIITNFSFPYESGIELYSSVTITTAFGAAATDGVLASIVYVLEPAQDGYLSN